MKSIKVLAILTLFFSVVTFLSCDEAVEVCEGTGFVAIFNVSSSPDCLETGSVTISQGASDQDFNIMYTDGNLTYPTWTGILSNNCSTIVLDSLPMQLPYFAEFDGGTITISGNTIVCKWSWANNDDSCTITAVK